jgi:hypothetical protein
MLSPFEASSQRLSAAYESIRGIDPSASPTDGAAAVIALSRAFSDFMNEPAQSPTALMVKVLELHIWAANGMPVGEGITARLKDDALRFIMLSGDAEISAE